MIIGGGMSGRNLAVFGIYPTGERADAAVVTLRAEGFRRADVAVLFPQNVGTQAFAHEKGTKSAEGAIAGGGVGAVIGGMWGWLAGVGLLSVPGVGPLILAGAVVAALAGIGAGGVLGGAIGALIGLGIPEYRAKRYDGPMRKGGILLSVHADDEDWMRRGRQVLEQTGAEHIASVGETKSDFGPADCPTELVEHHESIGFAGR